MIKEIEDFDINNFELKDLYESLIGAFIDLSFKQRYNLYKIASKIILFLNIDSINTLYIPNDNLKSLVNQYSVRKSIIY